MVQWFGQSWDAPICEIAPKAEVPVGRVCGWCGETFGPEDSGLLLDADETTMPYHVECQLRSVLGSVAHVEHRCGCFVMGSDDNDDPRLTKREAAIAAVKAYRGRSW